MNQPTANNGMTVEDKNMTGFTDIHSHFIYGVDDGAQTEEKMYAMLDGAHRNGISCLYATPHVIPGIKYFDRQLFQEHFEQAQEYCARNGYDITLRPGAELLYTPQMNQYADAHQLPTLGNTRFVLVEFSPQIGFSDIRAAVDNLEHNGYRPVIAHVERYLCLMKGHAAEKLKQDFGVLFQMNANTLLAKQPLLHAYRIRKWLSRRVIDIIGSDAHNINSRPFRIQEAAAMLDQLYGTEYSGYLTRGFALESV